MTAQSNDIEIREHTITTNGVDLHVLEAGEGPLVVLAHGFPELAYSWRHQLPALAAAGYHVIAPDQRGYGRSTRPSAIEDYDIVNLTGDLLGLLDHFGEEKAIFVGHDWGSMVVWSLALLAPERVEGVVGMSVPFVRRGPIPPIQLMKKVFGDNFFYILHFQEPGVAEVDLERDAATTMRKLLAGLTMAEGSAPDPKAFANDGRGFVERMPEPKGLPEWLTQEELDFYSAEFARTGFTGGVNWYRNFDRNWELTAHTGDKVTVPSLFVGGKQDPVLLMSPPSASNDALLDHRGDVLIDNAGHWVQQEKPAEVNEALLSFFDQLDLPNRSTTARKNPEGT